MITEIFKTSIYRTNVFDNTCKKYFMNILKNYIKEEKGTLKSNVGGFQTPVFKFDDNNIEEKYINNLIFSQCVNFFNNFKIKKSFQLNNLYYWINRNSRGSFNKPHIHEKNSLSGIYYLNVPKNSGDLVFLDTHKFHNDNFKFFEDANFFSEYHIEPKEFDLILFFSETIHYVQPNNSDQDRISVAFNININEN